MADAAESVEVKILKRQLAILVELNTRVEKEIATRSIEGDDGQPLKTWNDSLIKVKREAEQFLKEGSTNPGCPNPRVRRRKAEVSVFERARRRCRKAALITNEITKLLKESDVPEARSDYNPPSRAKICDDIFDLLKNFDNQFVGCYGALGFGKTTLALEVNDLKKLFEILVELNTNVEDEIVARSLKGDDGQALKTWNDSLKKVKREAEQFLKEGSANPGCPNPRVRRRKAEISVFERARRRYRKAALITKEITKLLNQKEEYGNIRSDHQVLEVTEAREEYNPPSRTKICEDICNLLKNSDNQFIGCYGEPGLGKTTLACEVLRHASKRTPLGSGIKDEKFFDTAIMIEVSSSPVIRKIQDQIADRLGISLAENGEMKPSICLYNALKNMETKVLIIFDDIWNMLDMRSIGIPCENGVINPRILLISRNVSALRNTGSSVNFQLEKLVESEAKMLFKSMVGKVEDETVAAKILEQCDCHPYIISVVADIVKNNDLSVWKDTFMQLRRIDSPDFDKTFYSAYERSIENVGGEEHKNLMLLCGIIEEHTFPVLNLLMYCVGLRLFKSIDSLETARERLHKLIDDLIDCSLLVGFDETQQCVKFQDVAMKSAARLAIKTNKIFTTRSYYKLSIFPDIPKNVTKISLAYAVDEFPDKLEFPDLEFFLYHSDLEVGSDAPQCHNSLFADCEKLRVLSLKGISTGIPSLVNLINLRTLCLHRCCFKDSEFPDVKELKKLKILSFRESDLTCLPMEVKMLTRLRLLDLHGCKDLDKIPAGLLSELRRLEHLYMRETVKFRWNRVGNASLSELASMKRLTYIEIDFEPGMELPGNMYYNKLQNFYRVE